MPIVCPCGEEVKTPGGGKLIRRPPGRRIHRLARAFLAAAALAMTAALVLPVPAGSVLFAALALAFPVALMALGAHGAEPRGGSGGALAALWVGLLALFEGCLAGMLLLAGGVADGPWLGGLPLAAALQLYGLLGLPLLVVPVVYALTFRYHGLSRRDLETLRHRFPPPEEEG